MEVCFALRLLSPVLIPYGTVTHGNYEYVNEIVFKRTEISEETKTKLMKKPANANKTNIAATGELRRNFASLRRKLHAQAMYMYALRR